MNVIKAAIRLRRAQAAMFTRTLVLCASCIAAFQVNTPNVNAGLRTMSAPRMAVDSMGRPKFHDSTKRSKQLDAYISAQDCLSDIECELEPNGKGFGAVVRGSRPPTAPVPRECALSHRRTPLLHSGRLLRSLLRDDDRGRNVLRARIRGRRRDQLAQAWRWVLGRQAGGRRGAQPKRVVSSSWSQPCCMPARTSKPRYVCMRDVVVVG